LGFGSIAILSARVIDSADFLNSVTPEQIAEVDAEVSDHIYQCSNYLPPSNPADAPGILRGIWADIVLFKIIKWQKNLSEEEIKRRTILKEDAYKLLDKIQSGRITVKVDSSTSQSLFSVSGTKRISTP